MCTIYHVQRYPSKRYREFLWRGGVGILFPQVYMSQFQLIPYNRIEDHFLDQMGVPLSAGTVNNFGAMAQWGRNGTWAQWDVVQMFTSRLKLGYSGHSPYFYSRYFLQVKPGGVRPSRAHLPLGSVGRLHLRRLPLAETIEIMIG